jgi:hypothetical protein
MGIVMIAAAKNSMAHKSLLDFLALANLTGVLVMLIFAWNIWHLADVSAVGLLGGLPLSFYPWDTKIRNWLNIRDLILSFVKDLVNISVLECLFSVGIRESALR